VPTKKNKQKRSLKGRPARSLTAIKTSWRDPANQFQKKAVNQIAGGKRSIKGKASLYKVKRGEKKERRAQNEGKKKDNRQKLGKTDPTDRARLNKRNTEKGRPLDGGKKKEDDEHPAQKRAGLPVQKQARREREVGGLIEKQDGGKRPSLWKRRQLETRAGYNRNKRMSSRVKKEKRWWPTIKESTE